MKQILVSFDVVSLLCFIIGTQTVSLQIIEVCAKCQDLF